MNSSPALDWWPEAQLRRNPLTKVFACGRQLRPPLFSHMVNFSRLEIPLRGSYDNRIECGGELVTVQLRPGTALFAPSNCWNLPLWRRGVKIMSLLLGRTQLGISIVTARGPDIFQLTAQKFAMPWPVTGPVIGILDAMLELHRQGEPQEAFVGLASAMICCVRELIEHPAKPLGNRAQILLESVCVYLQSHYLYAVTRESVARQFSLTPNYLSHLFKTHGSMTFSNYLTHVRMDRAKHLLRNYDLKLDDIAVRCGYRDTPYFCRVFKNFAKLTPAEYRSTERHARVNT